MPSNKAERDVLIYILGYTGVLTIPEHAGFLNGFVRFNERHLPPHRFVGMAYPACWWKGRHGINNSALRFWFPRLKFDRRDIRLDPMALSMIMKHELSSTPETWLPSLRLLPACWQRC